MAIWRREVQQRSILVIGAVALVLPIALPAGPLAAQTVPIQQRTTPLPEGRTIEARDGDLIVVDNDARVRFVRRRSAVGRLIFNAEERWAVLLADFVPAGGAADGAVDFSYNWREIEGEWPIEARWEGSLVIEDYMSPGFAPNSIGLVLPAGRLLFFSGGPASDRGFVDSRALAVLRHRGAGSSSAGRQTFDQLEPKVVAEAAANARRASGSVSSFGAGGVTGSLTFTASTDNAPASGAQAQGPVRVGGTIQAPRKIQDAAAVYPESMRGSGVGGVVILEAIVGPDGSVSSAKVLRAPAPDLGEAAVAAVKQWRYEPVLLNGSPVPVILTVTVDVRP